MKIKRFIVICIILVSSCKDHNDIYKTTSGAYASNTGKFVAKFPTEPSVSVVDNKVGLDEFEVFVYRSALGPNKIFSVEYIDYPENRLKYITDDAFLEQSVSNYVFKMSANFELDYKEPITNGDINGIYFVLQPKEETAIKGMIIAEVFRKGNRAYTLSYLGIPNDKVDTFMESFKITN